jgi:hypothetical protein
LRLVVEIPEICGTAREADLVIVASETAKGAGQTGKGFIVLVVSSWARGIAELIDEEEVATQTFATNRRGKTLQAARRTNRCHCQEVLVVSS